MFRKKTDENREILLQSLYNIEDRICQKLTGDMKTVAFTATDDKTNKTQSIVYMAKHLAEDGEEVLVIDANLRFSDLGDITGDESNRGFVDVVLGDYDIDDVLERDKNFKSLSYMYTGQVVEYADKFLEPAVIRDFFADIAEGFDYVFIDLTANIDIPEANMFAANADACVVFTRSEIANTSTTKNSLKQLEKANANILGLIISDYDYDEEELDELFGGYDE